MEATSSATAHFPGTVPAADDLFGALYTELHRLARAQLRANGGVSISATTLLHEAFLSMRERDAGAFVDRSYFIAYAARAMRGLVVDHARNRRAQKRGGAYHLTSLDTAIADACAQSEDDVTRVAEAIALLEQVDAALAELVDLKFFCGLSIGEIAALRGVSERTVGRDWLKARIYLRRVLGEDR